LSTSGLALSDPMFKSFDDVSDAQRPSFAALVDSAIEACPSQDFHPSLMEEDSDSWLNVDEGDFENLVSGDHYEEATFDKAQPVLEDSVAQKQVSKLKDFAVRVRGFVDGQGSLEGALLQSDADSDDSDEGNVLESSLSDDIEDSGSENGQELGQSDTGHLVPALDPADYGKMPAYYSNSQVVALGSSSDNKPKTVAKDVPAKRHFIPRDKYDGVDSDDETESEEERLNDVGDREGENSDSEEERPQVVGDVEIDMGEEEEDFIQFSREALGIDEEMWQKIVKDRQARGAFVPTIAPPLRPFADSGPSRVKAENAAPVDVPTKNTKLDSFEAVMQAMESELDDLKKAKSQGTSASSSTKTHKEQKSGEPVDDVGMLIDEELKGSLKQESEDEDELGNADVDYNLIKNFLESFKSQGGLSGPVGNLAGRIQPDWRLPRDYK